MLQELLNLYEKHIRETYGEDRAKSVDTSKVELTCLKIQFFSSCELHIGACRLVRLIVKCLEFQGKSSLLLGVFEI